MPDLHERVRHTLIIILQYHKDPRNRQWDGDWFNVNKRITSKGWNASVLRHFS